METFAGNGLLAKRLTERGVDLVSTSLFQSHDGHQYGMHFPVEDMESTIAVRKYGKERDVLLMSWPTTVENAAASVMHWGPDRPIVFIGEVTELDKGILGGCATDLFFDLTEETHAFSAYKSDRSNIDRAAVRQTRPDYRTTWDAACDARAAQMANRLGIRK